MFGSLLDLAENVVDIASAPVKIGAEVAKAVTDPVAEVVNDVVDEVTNSLR